MATKLQQDFQNYLGVHISLNPVDIERLFSDQLTHKLQFFISGWIGDYPDPQDWISLSFATGVPYNTMNFSDPKLDQLFQQADVEQDQTKRFRLYAQAEELAVQEAAWIPVIQGKNVYTFQAYIHGFVQDAGFLTPQSVWADVYITVH